jgi:hypothetical protein
MTHFTDYLQDQLEKVTKTPKSPIILSDSRLYQIIGDEFPREHEVTSSYTVGDNTVYLDEFSVEPVFILIPHTRAIGGGYQSSYMTESSGTITDFTVDIHGAKMYDNEGLEVSLTDYQKNVLIEVLKISCFCDEVIEE